MPTSNHAPARHNAQLTASDVSVTRGSNLVLSHVDVTVDPTSRIAIVGENGRGKSTLLQILDGTLTPDSGAVQRIGTLGVAAQEMPAHDDRTVGDAVADAIAEPLAALAALEAATIALSADAADGAQRYTAALDTAEALAAWDAERRMQIALDALDAETDPDRLLDTLSVGQRYRVRLACLLGAHDDFLLLDEPTNHLDRGGLEFLTEQLRAREGGAVVVTHDRALIADIADTIVDLDPTPDGRIRLYSNGYDGYRAGRRTELALWEQEFTRQRAEQVRLQDSLSAAQNRLQSGWRPDKGTNKHGRATRAGGLVQSVHRRQEQLDSHAVTVPEPPLHFRFPDLPVDSHRPLLSADEVAVQERLAGPITLELSRGDRLVVTGANGTGKSTLLDALAGTLHPTLGAVRRSPTTRLGYLRQETDLPRDQRVNNLYTVHIEALIAADLLEPSAAVGLSTLGLLRPRDTGKRIGELSMGQQRRLDLALVLASAPHVLLLDEPTNHLSIALVDDLTDALSATSAAVVLSTHDRQLLSGLNTWPRMQLGFPTVSEALA